MDVAELKISVKKEIVETINRICTSNPDTCCFGYCQFNKTCAVPKFIEEELPPSLKKLKSTLRNAKSKLRKKHGLTIPPIKKHQELHKRIRYILGCSIYDHELVKDDEAIINKIKKCTTMREVVLILQKKYDKINKKPISLPGGRYMYWKYKDENRD